MLGSSTNSLFVQLQLVFQAPVVQDTSVFWLVSPICNEIGSVAGLGAHPRCWQGLSCINFTAVKHECTLPCSKVTEPRTATWKLYFIQTRAGLPCQNHGDKDASEQTPQPLTTLLVYANQFGDFYHLSYVHPNQFSRSNYNTWSGVRLLLWKSQYK